MGRAFLTNLTEINNQICYPNIRHQISDAWGVSVPPWDLGFHVLGVLLSSAGTSLSLLCCGSRSVRGFADLCCWLIILLLPHSIRRLSSVIVFISAISLSPQLVRSEPSWVPNPSRFRTSLWVQPELSVSSSSIQIGIGWVLQVDCSLFLTCLALLW